jgi:DNA mismatch repair ATPase MutS
MTDVENIEKVISDNEIKLTNEEIDLISKNIIHTSGWTNNIIHSPNEISKDKINISDNVYQDLEMFISYNHDLNDTIYNKINYTNTKLGEHYLKHILLNPTNKLSTLTSRQELIKSLLKNPNKHQKISELLKKLNEYQSNGLWIWKDRTQEFNQIYEILYFKNSYLQGFNTSEWFLKIYNYFQIIFIPLYGLFSPIIFFILPYLIVRFLFGIKIPIKLYYNIISKTFFSSSMITGLFGKSKFTFIFDYVYKGLTLFMYSYGIYNSFKVALTLNNLINLIHKKVNHLARFIKTSYELYQEVKGIFNLDPLTVSYLELWDSVFDKEPYLLSDKGKILRTFFILLTGYNKFTPLLQMVGMIDSIHSITTLYVNNNNYYSYPEYKNENKPVLECNQIWNPFLDCNKAVKNDFNIDNDIENVNNNNVIITGPNASGKSTFIKSIVLGILFSQTLSIVPSNKMILSPFTLLNTYLNIPDAKGRESLFEAEMYRAKHHINSVKELKENQLAFVVMDEIFNSTNYEEGVAGAYIVAKELGQYKNSLSIITTHFGYLTKLSNTSNYINYMFDVDKVDDKIIKSYKIKNGVSKQYLALDLLENNGFSPNMIQEARTIFQELVARNNKDVHIEKEEVINKDEEDKEVVEEEVKEVLEEEDKEVVEEVKEEIENKLNVKENI